MDRSDDLLCLFTARIERGDGGHVIDVPERELDLGDLAAGGRYRVALFPANGGSAASSPGAEATRDPPIEPGDVRTVEIEGIGDQGDGIARVDRGYVVIVPGTEVGEEVTVEIEETLPNFAMAHVVDREG